MKKGLILFMLSALPLLSQAQWNGTTVPSTTLAKVGAGTNSPTAQLHVGVANAGFSSTAWVTGLKIDNWGSTSASGVGNIFSITHTQATSPTPPAQQLFAVDLNQTYIGNKLRIGSTAASGSYAGYTLSVAGDMIAKRCVIEIDSWADYVFKKDYKLPSLSSVESYVSENKHLPGVPSEDEIKTKGVDMGEMNKILMQKVEELTLYMIDLQKQNKSLQEDNTMIKEQLARLEETK